jgi:peptide/nickel transport system substrate-binding protein
MKSGSDNEDVAKRGMTRRQLLQAGAVAGVGAGLLGSTLGAAACGGSSSSSSSPAASGSPAAGKVKPGGVFTLATDQLFPKDNLNPLTNTTDGIDALEGMLREGLVTYDFTFTPQPRLAESWELSPDSTEYTFHIRPNVTWHDGTPFTARDAAWSLERVMSPDGGSGMMDRLSMSIEKAGVVVVDDMTLKLKLKRPDSLLLLALSNQQCYLTKENSTMDELTTGIGTGPFKLKSYNPGQSYEVEKYPGYWMQGFPILDGVRGVQIAEASTKLQSVASGSSSCTQIAFDQMAVVNANANLAITPYEKGITYNVVCDTTVKPFSDPRVRQAIKLSLNRKTVMDVGFAGQAFASPDAWVAMGDPFMDDTLTTAATTMDRAKATELMTAAGYPNGIDLTLKAPGDPLHANFSLAVVAGLKGSPFRVTAKQIPAATYWDTVWMKDPFCVDDWNRRHPVETAALNMYPNAPWNESKWKSPEMAALLDKAYAATPDTLGQATTDVCNFMRAGNDGGGSGEVVPAYIDRLWTALKTTKIVPWTFSMLDMRQCGFYA